MLFEKHFVMTIAEFKLLHCQVFVFSVNKDLNKWQKYNWTKISTVVMAGYYSDTLMCLAHSNGARVVALGMTLKGSLQNVFKETLHTRNIENIIKVLKTTNNH